MDEDLLQQFWENQTAGWALREAAHRNITDTSRDATNGVLEAATGTTDFNIPEYRLPTEDQRAEVFNSSMWSSYFTAINNWLKKVNGEDADWRTDDSYDYIGLFANNPYKALQLAYGLGEDGHLPDAYKTSLHPTFSRESLYSGIIDKRFNPTGIQGGIWLYNPNDEEREAGFLLSPDQQHELLTFTNEEELAKKTVNDYRRIDELFSNYSNMMANGIPVITLPSPMWQAWQEGEPITTKDGQVRTPTDINLEDWTDFILNRADSEYSAESRLNEIAQKIYNYESNHIPVIAPKYGDPTPIFQAMQKGYAWENLPNTIINHQDSAPTGWNTLYGMPDVQVPFEQNIQQSNVRQQSNILPSIANIDNVTIPKPIISKETPYNAPVEVLPNIIYSLPQYPVNRNTQQDVIDSMLEDMQIK